MEFISQYGLFFAKIVTLVLAILLLVISIIAIASKGKDKKEKLTVKNLNDKYDDIYDTMQEAVLSKWELKAWLKQKKQTEKAAGKAAKEQNKKVETGQEENKNTQRKKRIYVLCFNGDIKASAVASLREEVTALLSIATPQDEVVVCLESAGGMVHSYGLAAAQLVRIRENNIPLTVCIDKVAASGGYLMACVANRILAAPFAIIGSIGVVAQLPNFNRLLKKNHIDFELLTAGEFKRTLTVFGENTDRAREKFLEDLESIHHQFKGFIETYRPQLDLKAVATGEHWLAREAKTYNLVDDLTTSDDYLMRAKETAELYQLAYQHKKGLGERLSSAVHLSIDSFMSSWRDKGKTSDYIY